LERIIRSFVSTSPEPPKSNIATIVVGTYENKVLKFEFLFPPGGALEPGQVVAALMQYLNDMAKRKDAPPNN
jgi:hypothetical protein